MDGFDVINHLLFREVYEEVYEFFEHNPIVFQRAPHTWDDLGEVNNILLEKVAENPVWFLTVYLVSDNFFK